MKVLVQGEAREPKPVTPAWWLTVVNVCRGCETRYVIEADDAKGVRPERDHPDTKSKKVVVVEEPNPHGERTVWSSCPTCGNRVRTKLSLAARHTEA